MKIYIACDGNAKKLIRHFACCKGKEGLPNDPSRPPTKPTHTQAHGAHKAL